ncbi:MAG: outer membrane protein assembly factor BamB family protein [Breznakibacter sp.]
MRILVFVFLLFWIGVFAGAQIRFAFLTDIHVVPNNPNEAALKQVVAEINQDDYDFVVITGDLSNMGSDAELHCVKAILDQLTHPYYIVPGNHETNWSESAGMTFNRLWGADRFSFSVGNYQFLGYSTGPYMKMGDGLVKNEDLIWIGQQLRQSKEKGKTIISMPHYPLDRSLSNYKPLVAMLKDYDVPLSLCGHGHKLQQLDFDGIVGVMGRALMDKQQVIGYNQVIFRNDSAFVCEKKLGETPNLALAFPLKPNYDDGAVAVMAEERYEHVEPSFLHLDSCSVMGGAAMVDDRVVFANSCGVVKCHHARSGKLLWQYETGEAVYATPFTNGRLVFVGTIHRGLLALDVRTGALKWELPSQTPVLAEGVVAGDDLIIGLGSDGFVCVEAATGRVKWRNSDMTAFIQAAPVLTSDYVLFGVWDTYLYCLNRKDGSLHWKWNNGLPVRLLSPGNVVPAVANDQVFVVAPDRYLTVLGLHDGKQLMRTKQHKVRESMGLTLDGAHVVAKTMNDTVIFVDTRTHDITRVDCDFGYEHNPCPMVEIDGVVYGGTREGVLFAIDRKSRKYLFSEKLGCSSINKIVPAGNGKVLVTLMEGVVTILQPKK